MNPHMRLSLTISLFSSLASLAMSETPRSSQPSVVQAAYAVVPAATGAKPDAPTYPYLLLNAGPKSPAPIEGGQVRFTWDDTHLHAFFELQDHDVLQESDQDQRHHYETGDVVELFLKPEGATWYWEFYATPNGRKTAFFYPSRGYKGLPSTLDYRSDLKVTAKIDGTLNNWRDRDTGWTATISIPLAELAAAGIPLNAGTPWRVLVGRYNYGRYLPERELSMYPSLTKLDFHRHEEWARLELQGAPPQATP